MGYRYFLFTIGLGILHFSGVSFGAVLPYNEYSDENGNPRPQYVAFQQRTGIDPMTPTQSQVRTFTAMHPLGDNIRILPVPLVMDQEELEQVLRPGVMQRARALTEFFADVVMGNGRIFSASHELFPIQLTENLVSKIFLDEGWKLKALRKAWAHHTRKEISFFTAPMLSATIRGGSLF